MVQKKVEEERMKARKMMEEDMNKATKTLSIYSQLPKDGRSVEEIAKEARHYLELGKQYNLNELIEKKLKLFIILFYRGL